MKGTSPTRQITEGAILTGLFLVLALMTYYTPLFILSFLILPTPFIIIFVRTNLKISLLAVIAGTTILLTMVDPLFTASMGLTGLIIGGSLGYAFKSNWLASQIIFTGTIAVLILFLSLFFLAQLILGINLLDETIVIFYEAFESQVETMENLGTSETHIEEVRDMKRFIEENLIVFLPGAFIAVSIALGYLHTLINQKLLKRIGYKVTNMPAFQAWRFPVFLSWFYVIATIALFFQIDLHGYWGMFLANLFVLSSYLLLIQGLSLLYWLLKAWKGVPKVISVLVIILALAVPFLNLFVIILGVVDQFFNLRLVLSKKT